MYNKTKIRKPNKRYNFQQKITSFNEAGYKTYVLPNDQSLFMQGLDFKPFNSFYRNASERVKAIQTLVHSNTPEFVIACANYLGLKMGIRLAPTIMLTELALSLNSIEHQKLLAKAMNNFFTRPDFLAHAASYYKYISGNKSFGSLPTFFLEGMKTTLENMSEHTLISQKMKRREIKLKDLIKVLHPKPKTERMNLIYKDIIEDGPLSKCVVEEHADGTIKTDKITTLLSESNKADSTITNKQVQKTLSDNIDKWPINELIRNLASFDRTDSFKIYNRFKNLFESGNQRIVNPFDLFFINWDYNNGVVFDNKINLNIINSIDQAMKDTLKYNWDCKNPLIMFDVSGSMHNENMVLGLKYISLLKDILNNQFEFWSFDNHIYDITDRVKKIKHLASNLFAISLSKILIEHSGGTSIYDSLNRILSINRQNKFDGLIIITDEQTWDESAEIQAYNNILPKYNLNGKTLVINVNATNNSIFKPDTNVFRLYGQDAKIIDITKMIYNWNEFKQEMFNYI